MAEFVTVVTMLNLLDFCELISFQALGWPTPNLRENAYYEKAVNCA